MLIRVSFFQIGRIGFGSRRNYNFGGFQMKFCCRKGVKFEVLANFG
jgi:hypothetical protein